MSYQQPPDQGSGRLAGPPPGWYPDHGDPQTLRWWDGIQWSPHTQPPPETRAVPQPRLTGAAAGASDGVGWSQRESTGQHRQNAGLQDGTDQVAGLAPGSHRAASHAGQAQQADPYQQRPKKRHLVRNTVLGLGGVIVLIVILSVASNRGGNRTPAAGTSGAPANAAAASPQAAQIGTPVRDGKFQFTVTSVSHAKSVGDTADGLGDTAQGEYTILHVTVTNIGSQPQTLDDSSQYVYDADGRKYDASTGADIDLNSASGSNSVFFNTINPGNTVHGELAFDMPAGTEAVKAELHDSAFSGGITVNLP